MPYPELKGLLTDIGTEELGHLEMVGTIVHQLTRRLSEEQMREGGFDAYFVDHAAGVYPQAASGTPWNAASMAVKQMARPCKHNRRLKALKLLAFLMAQGFSCCDSVKTTL